MIKENLFAHSSKFIFGVDVKYAYEDLSPGQFEVLIIFICQKLLGVSVQGFSEGPDGGRDAKFVGIAECHPSTKSPWNGTTIVQAKHTNGFNRSFSEVDFFAHKSDSTVIAKEIPRIVKLKNAGQLDHYMLFSNRRLSGNAESIIRAELSRKCNIPESSIYLCGVEQIELFLKTYPDIPIKADLDPLDSPLLVSSEDLADVVEALARQKDSIINAGDHQPKPRVAYQNKNKLNNMSDEYAKAQRLRYLKETGMVDRFLSAPENHELLRTYESIIDEFQFRIISKRKDFHLFDEVIEYLTSLLFERDPVLRQHRRLTRSILFYMYWSCDIGESDLC